jgi:hypothetical protein
MFLCVLSSDFLLLSPVPVLEAVSQLPCNEKLLNRPTQCVRALARSNSIISQRICRTNFEKWSFRSAPLKNTTIVCRYPFIELWQTQCVGSGGATFLYLVPCALGCFPGRAFYFLRSRPFFLALVRRKQLASIRIKYRACPTPSFEK